MMEPPSQSARIEQGQPWLLEYAVASANDDAVLAVVEGDAARIGSAWRDFGIVALRGLGRLNDPATVLGCIAQLVVGARPLPYREQSSPRSALGGNLYSATHYPAHTDLHLHNELSYATAWPEALLFYCRKPADRGGATIISDCRAVYQQIPADLTSKFATRKWSYIRNLRGSAGLDWQTVFQTTSRTAAEEYCRSHHIELSWHSDGAHLRAVRPAITTVTSHEGDTSVWFNHVAAWHISTLPPDTSSALRQLFRDDDLPVNTYFGDGEQISDADVQAIRDAYGAATIEINWHSDDLAIIDNMRIAHGRRAYTGQRDVVVALAGERYLSEDSANVR